MLDENDQVLAAEVDEAQRRALESEARHYEAFAAHMGLPADVAASPGLPLESGEEIVRRVKEPLAIARDEDAYYESYAAWTGVRRSA